MKPVLLRLTLLTTIAAIIFVTCKKEHSPASGNNPQPDSTKYLPPYSGIWHGYITVTDVNPTLCYFSGDPISVTQNWMVKSDSTIKIDETSTEVNSTTIISNTWNGRIHNGDSITVTSTRPISCSGVLHGMIIILKEKIVKNGNKFYLTTSVDYPMCPPSCLFIFNYQMIKD